MKKINKRKVAKFFEVYEDLLLGFLGIFGVFIYFAIDVFVVRTVDYDVSAAIDEFLAMEAAPEICLFGSSFGIILCCAMYALAHFISFIIELMIRLWKKKKSCKGIAASDQEVSSDE